MLALADRLGHQHIPVEARASEIRGFLRHDAVHHDLVTRIVRLVYRRSRCGHLDAPLDAEATIRVLADARAEVLRGENTDICQYRFIEGLCLHSWELLTGAPALAAPPRTTGGKQVAVKQKA